jgi:hypothetical protein
MGGGKEAMEVIRSAWWLGVAQAVRAERTLAAATQNLAAPPLGWEFLNDFELGSWHAT